MDYFKMQIPSHGVTDFRDHVLYSGGVIPDVGYGHLQERLYYLNDLAAQNEHILREINKKIILRDPESIPINILFFNAKNTIDPNLHHRIVNEAIGIIFPLEYFRTIGSGSSQPGCRETHDHAGDKLDHTTAPVNEICVREAR